MEKSKSKSKSKCLRVPFRKLLIRLYVAIEKALVNDSVDGDLLPALFSVFSYLWCNGNFEKRN